MSLTDRTPRRDALDLAAVAVFLAGLALAGYIWRFGPPGPVPMHFDVHGRVDHWGDRAGVALVLAGLTALIGFCYAMISGMARSLEDGASGRRGLRTGKLILIVSLLLVAGLMTATTYGLFDDGAPGSGRLLPAGLSLLFLVIGALLGKSSPNPFVGIRTYWALRSRLAWDKSNRLAGRLFLLTGLVGLIAAPFASPPLVLAAVLGAIVLSTLAAVFESWRIWRADPERQLP